MQQESFGPAGHRDILRSGSSEDEAQRALQREAGDVKRHVEHAQLLKHQRLAVDLMKMSAEELEQVIGLARAEIIRWRRGRLCSRDYADRWDQLLDLPLTELAEAISSEMMAWGPALRQNSPFMFGREDVPQEKP